MKERTARFFQSPWALALIVAALGFVTFTRANGFPWQYHPDEKTKTSQVMEGTRNLRHPLLLLNTSDVASRLIPVKLDEQTVTRVGRYVSAIFALGAVVALALFARRVEGALCGWCVGLVAILNPQLVELAHYFKEDTALLLGWALTALSLWLSVERRTGARAACLGAALAVAGSAKYLGFLSLPIAIAVVGWAGRKDTARERWRFAGIAAAVFVALLLAINFQLLLNLGQFERSMDYEMYHVVNGQRGVAGDSTVVRYFTSLPAVFGWPVLIASVVGSLACIHPARRRYWLLAAFPWLYFLALSTSP